MTTTVPPTTAALDRDRLQAAIEHAARLVHPVWPIGRFIAVNPLGGLEDQPFEEAAGVAEAAFGAQVTLSEGRFREAFDAGRITSDDLDRALRSRLGDRTADAEVSLGGRRYRGAEILRLDLLHGEPAPAVQRAFQTPAERLAPSVADQVDTLVAKWCAVYLDRGQSGWSMPGRAGGLYAAWRPLAARDRSVSAGVRAYLAALPPRADDAILQLLGALQVDADAVAAVLEAELTRLPGWAGHLRWSSMHEGGSGLDEFLALRLGYEAALLAEQGRLSSTAPAASQPATAPDDRAARAQLVAAKLIDARPDAETVERVAAVLDVLPERERRWVWLEAYEEHQRGALLASLSPGRPSPSTETTRPAVQLVCCIDTRSEGLRRHFEALGAHETFGFAGFFAVAMRFQDLAGHAPTDQCPVLLSPAHDLIEQVSPGAERLADRSRVAKEATRAAKSGAHTAKRDVAAPFALAEATGWFSGPLAAARTLSAGSFGRARARLGEFAAPRVPTDLPVDRELDLTERVAIAEATLRTMGLVDRFAPVVVLCGHRSGTENNPFGAALDCGACGGHGGGPNARAAATILNAADVREGLRAAGIDVPSDTWFVAAEHETAADVVTLLDEHRVPASHRAAVEGVGRDLQRAGDHLSAERLASLPGGGRPSPRRATAQTQARGTDWAQVYPEWGLAGNTAMIVGPRSITQGLDLGRRTFLHSYDARHDPDGSALESILTAPLVVAQWINAQYYFSSVDPEQFGAGTKTIHNAVGGIGVLSGGSGDLRRGLPWQSVGEGERLVHEPVRLLAAVQAPPETIAGIVERTPLLQRLLGNGWIALAARDDEHAPWQRYTAGGWASWSLMQAEVVA